MIMLRRSGSQLWQIHHSDTHWLASDNSSLITMNYFQSEIMERNSQPENLPLHMVHKFPGMCNPTGSTICVDYTQAPRCSLCLRLHSPANKLRRNTTVHLSPLPLTFFDLYRTSFQGRIPQPGKSFASSRTHYDLPFWVRVSFTNTQTRLNGRVILSSTLEQKTCGTETGLLIRGL